MTTAEESKYSHRVYTNDPIKFRNYVNKRVEVTGKDSSIHEGIVYTVDPVSESVVLIQPKDSGDYQAKIVIGDSIKAIKLLESQDQELPEFFKSERKELSELELQKRKEEMLSLLQTNRFPAVEENEVIKIQGVISIEPPYEQENCLCANPIIMSRIQKILFEKEEM